MPGAGFCCPARVTMAQDRRSAGGWTRGSPGFRAPAGGGGDWSRGGEPGRSSRPVRPGSYHSDSAGPEPSRVLLPSARGRRMAGAGGLEGVPSPTPRLPALVSPIVPSPPLRPPTFRERRVDFARSIPDLVALSGPLWGFPANFFAQEVENTDFRPDQGGKSAFSTSIERFRRFGLRTSWPGGRFSAVGWPDRAFGRLLQPR